MPVNYEDLLDQARNGAPRSLFTPYVADLCRSENFGDGVKMRLLGNAVANCPENAAILSADKRAVDALLAIDPLGLQILYNGAVGNAAFATTLLESPELKKLRPSPASKNLLGAAYEALLQGGNTPIPRDVMAHLAVNGFIDLLVADTELESHPHVVKNFDAVFDHAQQCGRAGDGSSDDSDDGEYNTLGVRVVGNVTSHLSFTVENARGVAERPFTWESAVVLANLTSERKNIARALAMFNDPVRKIVELIREEDPEDIEEEEKRDQENSDLERTVANLNDPAALMEFLKSLKPDGERNGEGELTNGEPDPYEVEDEEDDGGDSDTPFDIEIWGPLLRNISRDKGAAESLARLYSPLRVYKQLVSYEATKRIGQDFVIAFAANCYNRELARHIVLRLYNSSDAAVASSMAASIYLGISDPSEQELMAEPIAFTITRGLVMGAPESVWVHCTKVLAMISQKFPHAVNKHELKGFAPESSYVQANIDAFSSSA